MIHLLPPLVIEDKHGARDPTATYSQSIDLSTFLDKACGDPNEPLCVSTISFINESITGRYASTREIELWWCDPSTDDLALADRTISNRRTPIVLLDDAYVNISYTPAKPVPLAYGAGRLRWLGFRISADADSAHWRLQVDLQRGQT